jgi:hypothetical protein
MDGELLGYEHRQIHHHLQQCIDCRTEYEELLQMKRLLAAMRLQEPGKRLAASIIQRVAAEVEPASVGIGNWRISVPAMPPRAIAYTPFVGLGVGLAVFGLMFWASPSNMTKAAVAGHRGLEFEPAIIAKDEPPPRAEPAPHVEDLTNGFMRDAAPQPAAFEPRYPDNLSDFPLSVHRVGSMRHSLRMTAMYR